MMEKQTGRKIKVLQIDNVREYKDQFLRFSQNTGIDIHFTIEKHGMVKEMNRSILEKVRCLLSNAQLNKSFWTEALEYASHLMNRLPSTVMRGKIPLDIWSSRAAQHYDSLWVFGYLAYFSVKDDKLNPQVKKFIFFSVKKNIKCYKL